MISNPIPTTTDLLDRFQMSIPQLAARSGLETSVAYRAAVGETKNPSNQTRSRLLYPFALSAPIRYRWMVGGVPGRMPSRRAFIRVETYQDAKKAAIEYLSTGRHIESDDAVASMHELARTPLERGEANLQSGGVYKGLGFLPEALDSYQAGERDLEGAENLGPEHLARWLAVQSNIANVLVMMGSVKRGTEMARSMLENPSATPARYGWAHCTIGDGLSAQGNFEEAVGAYGRALSEFRSPQDPKRSRAAIDSEQGGAMVSLLGAQARAGSREALATLADLTVRYQTSNPELALTATLKRVEATGDKGAAIRLRNAAKSGRFGLIMMRARLVANAALLGLLVASGLHDTGDRPSRNALHDTGDRPAGLSLHDTGDVTVPCLHDTGDRSEVGALRRSV